MIDRRATTMADVASRWLHSLTPDQRIAGQYPDLTQHIDSDSDRLSWFYTPTDHGGLPLGLQQPKQQQLAMSLLSTALTMEGYVAAASIIGLENVLDRIEDFGVQWGRERGRDGGLFYVRIYGDPRSADTWAWRFAGHHLSVNILVAGGRVVSNTPFFLGADPASSPLPGGTQWRPLGGIEDLAWRFVATLEPADRDRMQLVDRAVSDIVTGNRSRIADGDSMIHMQDLWHSKFADPALAERVDRIDTAAEAASMFDQHDHEMMSYTAIPKGLSSASLGTHQRVAFDKLVIAATSSLQPVTSTCSSPSDDAAGTLHIAWGGSLNRLGPLYFRLQSDRLLFEYDNTQRDGNHAHCVLRDPVADFGHDVLGSHRRAVAHRHR